MKLLHIEVSGWQCFVERTPVGPFGDGVNVVHAPNGTGKSTLFAALRHAIFDNHRRAGQDVETLRPWGRDGLAPTVTVEFCRGGATYRVEKRFLDAPHAALHREEAGRFARLSEREKADEFVRGLFRAEAPGRGASGKPEHWGVNGVLWVPQGSLALGDLHQPLASHIQQSLGTQMVGGADGDAIEQVIADRYDAIFTSTGKARTGERAAAIVTLRDRLTKLEAERLTLAPQVEAFEEASRRVEDLRSQRSHARHAEAETEATLRKLRDAATRYQQLEAERQTLEARSAQARGEHERIGREIAEIRETRERIAAAHAERAALAAAGPAIERDRDVARRRHDDAAAAVAKLRAGRESVDRAGRDAEAAAAFVRAAADARAIAERLDRVRGFDASIAELRKRLDALAAPSADVMRKLRRADEARRAARAALDASMIAVELTPDADATADVRLAERPGPTPLPAGRATVVRGSPEVVLEVPGFGRIRASGPAGSADERRAALDAAEAAFATLAAPLDTTDLDALQRRADDSTALQTELNRVDAQREAILGRDDAVAIERTLAAATRARDAALAGHPEWAAAAPDAVALRDAADTARRAHDRAIGDAEHARDLAADARQRAESAAAAHQTNVDALARRTADLAAALARLAADGDDDAARARRLAGAAVAWDAARAAHERATAALAAIGVNPVEELGRAERSLAALRDQAERSSEAEKRAEGRLEQLAAAGAYSALSHVLEQIAQAQEELARADEHAAAIKLLRDTVEAERQRLVRAVAGPVEAIATELLHRIAGPRVGGVRLGDRFAPGGVVSTLSPGGVELCTLSGGEQEQVHLAVRLALAEVLAREEPQMVVLDDVLVATDAGRLGRVLDVLAECGQRLQILILTCHPERYRAMPHARFFDLEQIREEAAVASARGRG